MGFCPLCPVGVPPHSQHPDSLYHLCIECPFLDSEGPRVQLDRVVTGLVFPHQQLYSTSESEVWSRLLLLIRHHLLLGNYVPCGALMRLLPGSSKGQKMRHFLLATTPLLFQMLLFHYDFSDVLHPVL